jgi:hypothetical protein
MKHLLNSSFRRSGHEAWSRWVAKARGHWSDSRQEGDHSDCPLETWLIVPSHSGCQEASAAIRALQTTAKTAWLLSQDGKRANKPHHWVTVFRPSPGSSTKSLGLCVGCTPTLKQWDVTGLRALEWGWGRCWGHLLCSRSYKLAEPGVEPRFSGSMEDPHPIPHLQGPLPLSIEGFSFSLSIDSTEKCLL